MNATNRNGARERDTRMSAWACRCAWPTRHLAALALLAASLLATPTPAAAQNYDIIIRNGRVIDGTGNDWFRADIAINGDQIVRIGRMPGATARRDIDATGMYVSPGFIDLHSHADRAMTSDYIEPRRAKSLNSQGRTTVIGDPDGRNLHWPISSEVAALQSQGHAMNFVPMVGHSTVRNSVMGGDYERPATEREIARMQELVRQGMEAGAWGLGAGVEYRPARFSEPEEIVALASVVAPYDGFYVAHQRSEAIMPLWQLPSMVDDWPVDGLQGLEETINIARETGIRVVASHHKSRGRSSFGRSAHDTVVVNSARAEGLEVYLDVYPYETFGGGARPMIPRWSLVHDSVDTSGGRDSPVYNTDGMFDNARQHLTRRWNDPAARADYRQEYTATASDAGVSGIEGVPGFASVPGAHPRHFGAFTRKIARYVKELNAISLPFAIRSMTGLPARIIGLEDRGLLRAGYKADIVIFDYDRIQDRATVLEPALYSEGVDYVMVNGVLTVDGGEFTDALPGEVVLRQGRPIS